MYKVEKCNFFIFWSVDKDLETCPYVEFWWTFWFQVFLKKFYTLSREIKHTLSKSPTRPTKGGLLSHPFLIHVFWVFSPRNKKKSQTFFATSPREFFVKKGGLLTLCVLFWEIRYTIRDLQISDYIKSSIVVVVFFHFSNFSDNFAPQVRTLKTWQHSVK